jgi:hypothetical protein
VVLCNVPSQYVSPNPPTYLSLNGLGGRKRGLGGGRRGKKKRRRRREERKGKRKGGGGEKGGGEE